MLLDALLLDCDLSLASLQESVLERVRKVQLRLLVLVETLVGLACIAVFRGHFVLLLVRGMVTKRQGKQELTELDAVLGTCFLEEALGVWVVESGVKEDLVWQVVKCALLFFVRAERLLAAGVILRARLHLCELLVLLVLVEVGHIVDLEGHRVARIVPQEGALRTDD